MSAVGASPTQLQPAITGRMLTVFVIGDVLGAALYVHRAFKSDFFTFVVASSTRGRSRSRRSCSPRSRCSR
jgi:hypothetical protein